MKKYIISTLYANNFCCGNFFTLISLDLKSACFAPNQNVLKNTFGVNFEAQRAQHSSKKDKSFFQL
jgi:hypothetical protein